MNTQPRIYKIDEPWCSCSFIEAPDVDAARAAIQLIEPCWAHNGPFLYRRGDIREYLHGSPLSLAVNRAIEASEEGREGDTP